MAILTIYGRLDGLNQYVLACRSNRYAGAKLKKKNEEIIRRYIKEQIPDIHYTGKVFITFAWFEPNKKRDLDNVAAGKKFILDALVSAGTISADNWSGVTGFSDTFYIDKDLPRVEVYIDPLEEDRDGMF